MMSSVVTSLLNAQMCSVEQILSDVDVGGKLFSKVATPFYIPTTHLQMFKFLCVLVDIWYIIITVFKLANVVLL